MDGRQSLGTCGLHLEALFPPLGPSASAASLDLSPHHQSWELKALTDTFTAHHSHAPRRCAPGPSFTERLISPPSRRSERSPAHCEPLKRAAPFPCLLTVEPRRFHHGQVSHARPAAPERIAIFASSHTPRTPEPPPSTCVRTALSYVTGGLLPLGSSARGPSARGNGHRRFVKTKLNFI